jgi:REP element-mobilizing transposase RayT
MAQSLAKVFLHVVFSTKERKPLIIPQIESHLFRYISTICDSNKCPLHKIGGMDDHIHLLLELSRTITIAKIVENIKSHSSRWVKSEFIHMKEFSWQSGYGVFSVDSSTYEAVNNYIANQKTHHKKIDFKEEFLLLLKRENLEYDERFLWD